ncbi:hypothetical protein CEUSTIGMA_g4925.t1 [Chlamydomonas eustigma]|uniref:tRNA-binding domain-containing protein n=1 Tax=Chlamydomonas eustigma TaxID=1157962 RepID=A0A250X343_9CHLO|nr:hypothetical protein CEUSTIGMA_g4925.t1 [Chlamydomonas eustigma]|eukprot:GAX77481.1 hypothetical protein CEUSTIGMA_g4925.t1 [Chlamydomonas eustigma]
MASALDLIDKAISTVDKLLAASEVSSKSNSTRTAQNVVNAQQSVTSVAEQPQPSSHKYEAGGKVPPAKAVDRELFAKANLKVAKIMTVNEVPNSEKLYKLTVDVGNNEIKQVCAGLKPYLPTDQLLQLLVVVVVNLKPAKLAGELSEAMILAADTKAADGSTLVRTLAPPPGSEPGDVVMLEGDLAAQVPAKQMKSDDWKKIVESLAVKNFTATFSEKPLRTSKGQITLPSEIPDGSGIH